MTGVFIAGIFSLIGIIIGGTMTIFGQSAMRAEKFKELFYKDKMIALKEINEGFWELFTTAHDCVSGKAKRDELFGKTAEFIKLIGRNDIFISAALGHKLNKLVTDTLGIIASENDFVGMGQIDTVKARHIEDIFRSISLAMREEIHTDFLTKSIKQSLFSSIDVFVGFGKCRLLFKPVNVTDEKIPEYNGNEENKNVTDNLHKTSVE